MRVYAAAKKLQVIPIVVCGIISGSSSSYLRPRPEPAPMWVADLHRDGWRGPSKESNKAFFATFKLQKLASLDVNTRLVFASNSILVAYHTKIEGKDWHTAKRWLEAFSFSAKDGTFLTKKQWPSALRKDGSDADSEARILALRNGQIMIISDGFLMLYSDRLHLIGKHKLEPNGPGDVWGASRAADGREIFLRHEELGTRSVTYEWIDAKTFKRLAEMHGNVTRGRGMSAVAGGVLDIRDSGIYLRGPIAQEELLCDNRFCRGPELGVVTVISSKLIGLVKREGIGVIDVNAGLIWSDTVDPRDDYHCLNFGEIYPSLSGNRFATWVIADRRCVFNSMQLTKGANPNILVFDTSERKHIFATAIRSRTWEWTFALSPDGTQLATFDGVKIAVYSID